MCLYIYINNVSCMYYEYIMNEYMQINLTVLYFNHIIHSNQINTTDSNLSQVMTGQNYTFPCHYFFK